MSTNTLWAHLLRKDTSVSQPSQASVPALSAHEKTSTSVRILLHDTQANVEKFSERVGQLIANVMDTKQELLDVKKAVKNEQERFSTEVYDLVNRSQREIQRSLGNPAQASSVEQLSKDTSLRLDGLDKRLDALHLLQKTVSEILQTQSGVLQAIQNQQATITNAVIPLLPLVQALPLHIARPPKQRAAQQSSPVTTLHGTSDPVSSSPARPLLSPPASFSTEKDAPRSLLKRKRATPGVPDSETKRIKPIHETITTSRSSLVTPVRQQQSPNDPSVYSSSNRSRASIRPHEPSVTVRTPVLPAPRRDSRIPDLSHKPASSAAASKPSTVLPRLSSKIPSTIAAVSRPKTMLPPSIPESSLRARRSPFRPGRRFIPLDDSDSDD